MLINKLNEIDEIDFIYKHSPTVQETQTRSELNKFKFELI